MNNRLIETKTTKQIVIDKGLHQLLKIEAARRGETIRQFVESYIYDGLERDNVEFE